jgi:D-serine deaminase-like pyridoxal phosphate-dependent protein
MPIQIQKPTLLLNEDICKANIKRMAAKAQQAGARFTPHFKTHQSGMLGQWFRQLGVVAITVSSVSMARYFAMHGWDNICIAFPVNMAEMDELNRLAKSIHLQVVVEDAEVVEQLGNVLENSLGVYIKIDVGAGRTGIPMADAEGVRRVYERICNFPLMRPEGLLAHAGQTYHARGVDAIADLTVRAFGKMNSLRLYLNNSDLLLSWGDTPSCSMLSELPPFDEWRPGNFVFYDVMQYHIGACQLADIAVAMACPVVAVHPERKQAVIYGGAVHFSKEFIEADKGFRLYGYVVELTDDGWGPPIAGAWLGGLSQEHGILNLPDQYLKKVRPGDILGILPVHSCLTVSCMREMYTTKGQLAPCMK